MIHANASVDEEVLRISNDAKARVHLGPLSRGGKSRVAVDAQDHDFVKAEDKVHLDGFHLPDHGETYLFFLTSPHLTSDAIVDCLEQLWTETLRPRFPNVKRLLLDLDNGPENNSRRTQFMNRLVEFARKTGIEVELAYYPPYHSKYNPIERVWGVLEQHWNGSLLDTLDTAVRFAESMTYKGIHPVVHVVKKTYEKGVSLTKKAMQELECGIERLEGLEKYFVTIPAATSVKP